ncbi:MAG TPA: pentapeptide repeat-containing protein [Mucilaginibacter sp.]|nr:pentapeptide repeat-containing protein [Mucilaginibacter sp.]
MEQKFEEGTIYKNIKAADLEGHDRTFEDCTFIKCDLSYANLSHITFINCVMDTCNLSLIKITDTGLQNVDFKDCKITGVNFGDSSNFSLTVSFTKCILDYTVWHKKKLKGTSFTECSFEEADFSETDLTNAVFEKCSLNRAIFNRTILKGADLRTAYNFNIDPENSTINKAKFSADALAGLLVKYNLVIE